MKDESVSALLESGESIYLTRLIEEHDKQLDDFK